MTKTLCVVLALLTACATAPKMDLDTAVRRSNNQVVCFVRGFPATQAAAQTELAKRQYTCTEQDVADGRQAVRTAMLDAEREDEATKARRAQFWTGVGNGALKALDAALTIGAIMAVGQAMRPAPPPPVVCQTAYNGTNATTTCQ